MADLPAAKPSSRVTNFLEKFSARGRLIFVLDATGSRQPTWDAACKLQSEMFKEAARLGALQIQLVYFRGLDGECKASSWTSNANTLTNLMSGIICRTGQTQIVKALAHAKREHASKPVNAIVYIGDMCEEPAGTIHDAAAGLGVPCFVFMEGNDDSAEPIFRDMARLTRGAFERFDSGAVGKLAELLRAVAAFATGGAQALRDMRTDSARKLLGQLK